MHRTALILDHLQTPFSLKICQGLINLSSVSYNRGMNEKGLAGVVPILPIQNFLLHISTTQTSREKQAASDQRKDYFMEDWLI